jgi:hypothetical protein
MATRTLNDWDFDVEHVQDITSGSDFLSSESVVICAGPPSVTKAAAFNESHLIPIGVVQNAQVSQSKQLQQFFEVGSREPFFIPGRTFVNASLGRVMFDGPSVMKALYMQGTAADVPTDLEGLTTADFANAPSNPQGGSGNFYINLSAKFFNNPLGLAFLLNDMDDNRYGGFYLENCFIQQHTLNVASQQTVLFENVSIRCSRLVPLNWKEA